jgi:diguanylate cyclase (GGDEF)-like protein
LPELDTLHSLVLDSLEEQVAVIDSASIIIYVNRAWRTFGTENGMVSGSCGIGSNYLKVCNASGSSGDSLAGEAERGLLEVLGGKRDSFHFEYPCHSPAEQRWFMMRVAPLQGGATGQFVISHHNITQRKLAEQQSEYLSLHDPLTGLANRRQFNQFLDSEWRRNARNRTPLGFIMFDLDHFKDYNDELGHLAGDQCLVNVAQVLQAHSGRPGDLAVRYGGEEFALLLGNTGTGESVQLAEAIRNRIYELDMRYRGTLRVTISAGVAAAIPGDEQTAMSLVREADDALYRAKQMGRNRIDWAAAAK